MEAFENTKNKMQKNEQQHKHETKLHNLKRWTNLKKHKKTSQTKWKKCKTYNRLNRFKTTAITWNKYNNENENHVQKMKEVDQQSK